MCWFVVSVSLCVGVVVAVRGGVGVLLCVGGFVVVCGCRCRGLLLLCLLVGNWLCCCVVDVMYTSDLTCLALCCVTVTWLIFVDSSATPIKRKQTKQQV